MTEQDYIKVVNRVRVSAAIENMRDVLFGDEYAVNIESYDLIMFGLSKLEKDLFDSVEISPR